jgi:hypothetical protein
MGIWKFAQTEPCDDGDGFWACVEGPDGDVCIDGRWDTQAEAEKAGREFCAEMNRGSQDWVYEAAICAGMEGGIDAYNDARGY